MPGGQIGACRVNTAAAAKPGGLRLGSSVWFKRREGGPVPCARAPAGCTLPCALPRRPQRTCPVQSPTACPGGRLRMSCWWGPWRRRWHHSTTACVCGGGGDCVPATHRCRPGEREVTGPPAPTPSCPLATCSPRPPLIGRVGADGLQLVVLVGAQRTPLPGPQVVLARLQGRAHRPRRWADEGTASGVDHHLAPGQKPGVTGKLWGQQPARR